MYAKAVRGVWAGGALDDDADSAPPIEDLDSDAALPAVAALLDYSGGGRVRLGLSSLWTGIDTWNAGASGQSDTSLDRYQRIATIVNHAVEASPKPTYLLLPELAIPECWIGTVAGRLLDSRVNLVAGLDYTIEGAQIRSSAVLVLGDERLGYSSSVQIRQWKSLPAAKEEMDLLLKFGKTWKTDTEPKPKPIYIHGGFAFGLLVCSELQNVQHRLNFQGKVDGLMILSWNQDLETFSALVESASLDVHAAIALVNNREFGDSRVRVPAKKSYERDLCRIRGGLNEHLVVVELDVQALRSFQSRATRAPSSADRFKPVPEGFSIANYRKTIPT